VYLGVNAVQRARLDPVDNHACAVRELDDLADLGPFGEAIGPTTAAPPTQRDQPCGRGMLALFSFGGGQVELFGLEDGMRLLTSRLTAAAVGMSVLVGLTYVAGAAAALPPAKTKCPAASVVNAALGQHFKAPTSQTSAYAKICIYKGTGIIPTRIQFQVDTAATFAAGEKAAAASGEVVKVKGLGKAAFSTKVGGFLAVFLGSESIRITSPLVPLAKLEKLARKLI
jgi:hypothetical protein